MRNLLRPETRKLYPEARKFANTHACALCLADLAVVNAGADGYQFECPTHGTIYPHNHIGKRAAEYIQSDRRAAAMELNAEAAPKKTEAQLLKELGY